MPTLTVTAKGQITLKKSLLEHLGIRAGSQVEVNKLASGKLVLTSAQPKQSMENFIGCLAIEDKQEKCLSIEEINKVISDNWSKS